MVLRVCRRVLGDPDEAQDAFQATFLCWPARPTRSGTAIRWGVGCSGSRPASRPVRAAEVRRRAAEARGLETAADRVDGGPREAWPELHEEVARLPEKYRDAVRLCYLESLTHEKAAEQLRCPVGTVSVADEGAGDAEVPPGSPRPGAARGGGRLGPRPAAALPPGLVEATARAASICRRGVRRPGPPPRRRSCWRRRGWPCPRRA